MGDRTILDALMEGDTSVLDGLQIPEAPPPAPGAMGYVQQFGSSLLQGAAGTTGEMLRGAGTVLGSVPGVDGSPSFPQAAYDVNEALPTTMEDSAKAIIPSVPGAEGNFLADKLPRAIGSMAPFLATGGVASLAALPPELAAAAGGALVSGSAGFYEAKYKGADESTQWKSFALNAAVGSSMALPVGRIFSRVDKASGGMLKRALVDGVVAGGQNAGQQAASNIIAQHMYDDERDVLAGVAEGGGAGFLTGVILGAAANARKRTAAGTEGNLAGQAGNEAGTPAGEAGQSAAIPGMPEPAPTVDLTGGGESMAAQEAQPGPVSPVSPGMSGGEAGRVALETKPVEGQAIPVIEAPTAASDVVEPSPPAPAVSPSEGTAGVSVEVFHGTPRKFSGPFSQQAPKTTLGGLNRYGFSFGDEKTAKRYASDFSPDKSGVVIPARLSIERPLDMSAVEFEKLQSLVSKVDSGEPLSEFNEIDLEQMLPGWKPGQHPVEWIKQQGYDSIRKAAGRGGAEAEILVFDPNKITRLDEPAPSPETKTAAPVEALKKDEGAALPTPEQTAQGEDANTIALRHETTAAKRAERDFPEYERTPSRKDEDLKRQAIESLTADPFAGRKLVEKVAAGHIPDDAESFLLLAEANRLRNELKLADVEAIADPSESNKALVDSLSAEFNRAMDATDAAGTQQGRSFRVRAQQMREDYSLAGVVRKKAKALGRSLNEAEMEHAREVTRKLDELEKRVTEAETRQDTIEADRIAQEKLDTLKREVRARAPRQQRIQRNRAEMDTILSRLASRKAHSGLDPEMALDVLKFAKLAIENGVLKFADFAADIVKAGEHVRPYLQKAWDQAVSERHAELVTPVRERFKAGEAPGRALDTLALHFVESGITERDALIDALHKAVPDATREQLRDALSRYGQFKQASQEESHKTLRQLKQEMQKVAQIEALEKRMAPLKTGFDRGEPSPEYRRLAKRVEALKKETGIRPPVDPERALKSAEASRETYLRNRITDLRDEIATGKREARERGEPPTNETIKALEAELETVRAEHEAKFEEPKKREEVKKQEALERQIRDIDERTKKSETAAKGPRATVDTPEVAKLRSELEAKRAQLDNMRRAGSTDPRIAALRREVTALHEKLQTHDLATRGAKQGPEVNPEVAALRQERDALNAQLKLARSKPAKETTPADILARREKQRIAAIERTAKHYEKLAEDMNLKGGGTKEKPIDSDKYRAAVAHRDAARAVVEELRALANPKATPEERATKAALTRLTNETAAIQQRITFKDFGPREKPVKPTPSSEVVKATAERDRLKRQFELENYRAERENRTRFQKARDFALDLAFKTPRSIVSSIDFSAVLNQGGLLTAQDMVMPWRWPGAAVRLGRMFRAFKNEAYADRVKAAIESDPGYEVSQRAGLELPGYGDGFSKREENFNSSLAAKIPGVKGSERAYVTYLNSLRLDHFNRIFANTDGSPEAAKSVARLVNEATGRGQVGKGAFAKFVDGSGYVLWSPRNYVSRFQLLYGDPLIRGTGARKAIAREYAATIGAIAAMYSLAAIYNATDPDEKATMSLDPSDPDGGKIKIGNTRIDLMAGLLQTTRLEYRVGRAVIQGIVDGKSKEDLGKVGTDFLRTKISPAISLPVAVVTGRDLAFGRPFDRTDIRNYGPMAVGDILKVMEDQGVPRGTAFSLLALFGARLNTYEKKK